MFIYDADAFTRKFTTGNRSYKSTLELGQSSDPDWTQFSERLGVEQPPAQSLNQLFPASAEIVHKLPDYNGFGTLEDSEQNCKKIVPGKNATVRLLQL